MFLLYSTETGEQIGQLLTNQPTPQPGQAFKVVPHSMLDGMTEWSAVLRGFVDAPQAPPPPPRPVCVDLHSDAGATLTLTNMPSAAQFMANSNRHIEKIDLSMFTQARLLARVLVAGSANATFAARVHNAFSTAIADYQIMGADVEISVPLNVLGVADSGWRDIAPAALADNRFVAVRQSGGDGVADPQIGRVSLWLR